MTEILHSLTYKDVFLAISYIVNLVALLVRDILWLRSILMGAQLVMITYAFLKPNHIMVFSNALFLSINSYQVVRLLLERRPIQLPENLEELYSNLFAIMSKREFLYFWNTGKVTTVEKTNLCNEGEVPHELMLIVDGTVSVQRGGKEVVQLGRGAFVAEMSFMTGEQASADVICMGPVEYIAWDRDKLSNLKLANPDLMIKIQVILGKDLTQKLKIKG